MKDFLGQEVQVGDYIFYSTTGRNSESRVGKIIRLGKVYPTIEVVKGDRSGRYNETPTVRNTFIKIDYY